MDAKDDRKNLFPTPGPHPAPRSLFESTSEMAGHVAAKFAGIRYRQILELLRVAGTDGLCIFEIAAKIGCHDHQISGRFGELVDHLLIRRTGERREKPSTGCQCDVYQITLIGLSTLGPASPPE